MAASTVLSRVTGFARVAALAWGFGYGLLADTYNLANTTPNIIYELVLGGVLSATLVPVFVERLATRDDDDAWHAVSAVDHRGGRRHHRARRRCSGCSRRQIIRLYTVGRHGPEAALQVEAGTRLLRMFAPQIAAYGLISLLTAVLHAREQVRRAPALTPVLNNVVVTGAIALAAATADNPSLSFVASHRALWILGLGTTAGVVVQAIALLPSVRSSGARLRPVWAPRHEAVRRVLRLSSWTVGYVDAQPGRPVGRVPARKRRRPRRRERVPRRADVLRAAARDRRGVDHDGVAADTWPRRWAVGDRARFSTRFGDGIRACCCCSCRSPPRSPCSPVRSSTPCCITAS